MIAWFLQAGTFQTWSMQRKLSQDSREATARRLLLRRLSNQSARVSLLANLQELNAHVPQTLLPFLRTSMPGTQNPFQGDSRCNARNDTKIERCLAFPVQVLQSAGLRAQPRRIERTERFDSPSPWESLPRDSKIGRPGKTERQCFVRFQRNDPFVFLTSLDVLGSCVCSLHFRHGQRPTSLRSLMMGVRCPTALPRRRRGTACDGWTKSKRLRSGDMNKGKRTNST